METTGGQFIVIVLLLIFGVGFYFYTKKKF